MRKLPVGHPIQACNGEAGQARYRYGGPCGSRSCARPGFYNAVSRLDSYRMWCLRSWDLYGNTILICRDLLEDVARLSIGKAPGPDHIPNEILRLTAHRYPEIFLEMYEECITTGQFPSIWKCAKMVLLYNCQNKPPEVSSS